MPTLLLTGYEPFDDYSINPSAEIAKSLDGRKIGKWSIIGSVIPLDYQSADQVLNDLIESNSPEIILCCGQANRAVISLERIAVNAINVSRVDNKGYAPENDIIVSDAPAAYFSNINLPPLVEALNRESIPAYISYHAGTYGCNWILFKILHSIAQGKLDARATFIHVPPLPSQAIEKKNMSLATMPLATIVHALEIIIQNLE
jgi:pyroglutamyl-peptidase